MGNILQYIPPPIWLLSSLEYMTDTLMTPPTGVKAQCRLKKTLSKMDWFVSYLPV